MDREEAARKFAEAMGWEYLPGGPCFERPDAEPTFIPTPEQPLWRHLAFVGRVAEAVDVRTMRFQLWDTGACTVSLASRRASGTATDPSWAAIKAALAAKGAR